MKKNLSFFTFLIFIISGCVNQLRTIDQCVVCEESLKKYTEKFNKNDNEIYIQHYNNQKAYEFLSKNIPLISLPNKDIEETYYFRWWTFRKHIKNTADDSDILFQSDDDSGGVKTYLQLDGSEGNVRIPDSVEFNLGNSQDFRVVHDGSNTQLKNYTGTLFISNLGTNGDIIFQVDQGGQDQRLMVLDGSRDAVAIGRRADAGTLDPGDDKLLVAGDVGVTGSLFVSSSITTQGNISGNISSSASSTSSLGALNLHNTLSVSSQSGHLNGGINNIPLLVSRNNSITSTLALVSTGSAGYSNYMQFLTSELNQMGSIGFALATNNKFVIANNMQNQDMIFQVKDAANVSREAFRIDASANRVGIYNSSPTKELVVSGAISASGDLFIDDINTTGTFTNTSGTLKVSQSVSDADIEISVNDGGTILNAITIDASAVGTVRLPNDSQQLLIGANDDLRIQHNGSHHRRCGSMVTSEPRPRV